MHQHAESAKTVARALYGEARNDRLATMARRAVDDEGGFDRAWRQGREMPLNEAIELAFGATTVGST